MRKLILLVMLLVSIIVTADNLDKYESKIVLDKYLDVFINKDLSKYANDKDLKEFYEEGHENASTEAVLNMIILKDYKILSVKEDGETSKIELTVVYKPIDKITNKSGIEREIKKYYEQNPVGDKNISSMYALGAILYLQMNIDKYVEYKTETKNIEIVMDKSDDGKWYIEADGFFEIIFTNLEEKLNEAGISYFG